MNTIVSFPIAKLLKETGYDNETNQYYDKNGNVVYDISYPSLQPTKPEIYYDTPTISDIVMWIYKKYGIWIESRLEISSSGKRFTIYIDCVEISKNIRYSSPTEAYLSAIEYTLKNN